MGDEGFTWNDGERRILFGEGLLSRAADLLAEQGMGAFELVSTPRALASAPLALAAGAVSVHEVGPGGVPELARPLAERMARGDGKPALAALGGGRVIDVAKAVAAVRGRSVAALPTTLSGAEMTAIHRLPQGIEEEAGALVRPVLVVADPAPMTSAPEPRLRASAINALAHGAEALYTPLANPLASMAALRGAALIASALDSERAVRDRAELSLGAILCAYAVGSSGLAVHHATSQTLVRTLGLPHAETNAAILPASLELVASRAPAAIARLADALGVEPAGIVRRVDELAGGARRLSELGAPRERIDEVLDALERRPDIAAMTPHPPPGREELRALLESRW